MKRPCFSKHIRLWTFMLALLYSSAYTFAQNLETDLNGIKLYYEKLGTFHQDMKYTLLENGKATEKVNASLDMQGGNSFQQYGPVYLLNNAQYSLMIDTASKALIVSEAPKKNETLYRTNLDSIPSLVESSSYKAINAQTGSYHITYKPFQQISTLYIEFDLKTFELHKLHIIYNPQFLDPGIENMELQCIYEKAVKKNFSKDHFSEKKYIVSEAGTLKPARKYNHYLFYDYKTK